MGEYYSEDAFRNHDDVGIGLCPQSAWVSPMRKEFPGLPFRGFAVGFMVLWIIGAIMSLSFMGLLLYCLYRVATHPW